MLKLARLNQEPEIFYTIQGEGKNLGHPSVFIRLSLCNLYCVWCDTDYTWNWKDTKFTHLKDIDPAYSKFSKEDYIIQLTNEEIIKTIQSYHCLNLVFTGGEPLAQQKELAILFGDLLATDPGYRVEIETNGTIIPSAETDRYSHQYNVSLKLSNSGVTEKERLKPAAIAFFAASSKSNLKFVIDTPADLDEVLQLVNDYHIDKRKVYLMPQGMTADLLREKQQWLIEKCKTFGFNYTDRLHIHIYGNKRGV
jgi:7-carboxy-7-deazaguanine synthase